MFRNPSFKVIFSLAVLTLSQVSASPMSYGNNFLEHSGKKAQIIVNNRPLAKINGKVFSVMDVKKQMDIYLAKSYPQMMDDPESILQFYVQNWRPILQEMVDNELMLMEANELAYKVEKPFIREEMEQKFGANVNERLEELGLTPTEAEKLVEEDLICKSMMWYRVWQRSMNKITPQVVYDHYVKHIEASPSQDEWTYQMCTIRGKDSEATAQIAKDIRSIFSKTGTTLGSSLTDAVAAVSKLLPSSVNIKLSDDIQLTSQQLSAENLSILESLKPTEISEPVSQKSRYDDQTVTRLFHLKNHTSKSPPSFEQVSNEIRDALVGKASESVRQEYLSKLRKRFCCEHLVIEKMYDQQTKLFILHA